MTLTWPVVQEIQTLLADGRTSQRKIAKQMGVSRGTVASVAKGRLPRVRTAEAGQKLARWPREPQARRCRQCGQMVHHPCLTCHLRGLPPQRPPSALSGGESRPQSLQLNLAPEMQARYRALRRQLQTQGMLAGDSSAVEADWK